MFEDTVVPKRCPVCASDNIEFEDLAEIPEAKVYQLCWCWECKSKWTNRATLHWYKSEVTHRGTNEVEVSQ